MPGIEVIEEAYSHIKSDFPDIKTPCYIFHEELFSERARLIRSWFKGLPLIFSMKANPFLLSILPPDILGVEVCSPGELSIAKKLSIDPEKIIYSGVLKEAWDIGRALDYGVGLLTVESTCQAAFIENAARERGKWAVPVLLRLSSGNQFGMDEKTILELFKNADQYPHLDFYGIHYYSGTAKHRVKDIERDVAALEGLLLSLESLCGYSVKLLEYGPGFKASYFSEDNEKEDIELLRELSEPVLRLAEKYPLQLEMGRFLAAPSGEYVSSVKDLKETGGGRYAILDGGIHQLNYYGQTMAMRRPPLRQEPKRSGHIEKVTLCGSLCTVADVLLKEAELSPLEIGDRLCFQRSGAYSVTEAPALFLSRQLPRIYLESAGNFKLARDFFWTDSLNSIS